jgi:hypothetical protein
MKPPYATFFAAALLVCAKPAFAADNALDVSELTCDQFMKYDDNNKGLIMMWLEGYYTEEDEAPRSISARWPDTWRKSSLPARPILARRS